MDRSLLVRSMKINMIQFSEQQLKKGTGFSVVSRFLVSHSNDAWRTEQKSFF